MNEALSAERQKYWKELRLSEKIERMRDTVKRLQSQLSEVSNLRRVLENHRYDGNDLVLPVNRSYGEGEVLTPRDRDSDEVYF